MRSNDPLTIAAYHITRTNLNRPGPYGLFITNGIMHAQALADREPGDLFLFRFTREDVLSGLKSSDWVHLARIVTKLYKENLL